MVWTVSYTETARKQLKQLDRQAARRLVDFMDERVVGGVDPRGLGQALKGPLLGTYWRYRVGDYRIICDIQDGELVVLVLEFGNRKDVYR
ncbi:MAG: type II toxin-antitoxin system RelE/ParE family toxin [Burkholderiales bacterium]|nr:type II toxin-antitoxin system RelE/ParE family toxin [Burkholderiales bacterium]